MAAPVFVSHSSKDREIVVRLCRGLESRGIKCWVSSRDVAPGENYQEAIVRAIGKARVMVLVFTQNANNSDEIKKEISLASQHKLTVIPVRVEDVVPSAAFAYELATRQWINMFDDWDQSIRRLEQQVLAISALESEAPPQADAQPPRSYAFASPPPQAVGSATRLTPARLALGLVIAGCLGFGGFGLTTLLRAPSPAGETQRGDLVKSEPANGGTTKTEIAKADPAKAEPPKIEPVKVEPAKIEPAKIETAPGAPTPASDKGGIAPAPAGSPARTAAPPPAAKSAEAPVIAAKPPDAAPAATQLPVASLVAPIVPPAAPVQAPAAAAAIAPAAEPPPAAAPAQPAVIPAAVEPAPKAAEPKAVEPESAAPKLAAAPAPAVPAAVTHTPPPVTPTPASQAPAPTPAPSPAPAPAPAVAAPVVAGLQAPVAPTPPPAPPPIAMAPPAVAAVGDGGQVFQECESCAEMVVIPAGTALIGSAPGEPERRPDEGPRQEVRFATPFAVGRYEVSFAEWDACVAEGGCNNWHPGDYGWGRGEQPVIFVSWNDARDYAAWLARKTGQPYRLLSESEYEYVARACRDPKCQSRTFWFGDKITPEVANYNSQFSYAGSPKANARRRTLAVNAAPPNPFGLYHILGNVRQWVADCWNPTLQGLPLDGRPRMSGDCSSHVVRGGSWSDDPVELRASARSWDDTKARSSQLGFRVARDLLR